MQSARSASVEVLGLRRAGLRGRNKACIVQTLSPSGFAGPWALLGSFIQTAQWS